ncbi:hypothetical protein [Salipiger mucosus]|nr:hypothetical protein [Salipiger mucosus]
MTDAERRLRTDGWISVQPDMFDAQRQSHWVKGDLELVLEKGVYFLMESKRVISESEDVRLIIEKSHEVKVTAKGR